MGLLYTPTAEVLNSDQTAVHHRVRIMSKPFLHRFYREMYAHFQQAAESVEPLNGEMLELGSGAGFLKDLIPQLTTSDVSPFPYVDRVVFADHLPFGDGRLKAIFAMNVLHHLADPEAFFSEAARTLTPGGRLVLIEPYCSFWGRWVYRYLHYEPFDLNITDWKLPDTGRLTTANGALPTLIFERDRARFERLFPKLQIQSIQYHTVFRYLLSGGVSWPAFAPVWTYSFFSALDSWLSKWPRLFPMFQTITLKRTT